MRIGPDADPFDPASSELMSRAREEAQRRADDEQVGRAMARRIFGAFVACVVIALACFVAVPAWMGVFVPAWVPLLSFLAIATGAILTMPSAPKPDKDACCEDEGRPIGCCSGPRPLRSFREDR